MIAIGDFLKQQRQTLGLSMSEVHEQTGITDSKLSRIERCEGRPSDPLELKKLAELYQVNIVTLWQAISLKTICVTIVSASMGPPCLQKKNVKTFKLKSIYLPKEGW